MLGCFAGSLVGTHAHELMMVTTQLLSAYDDMAGGAGGRPVPVAALLAHLLFLREVGGLARPTALTDTFGTSAFIQVGSPVQHWCLTWIPSSVQTLESGVSIICLQLSGAAHVTVFALIPTLTIMERADSPDQGKAS